MKIILLKDVEKLGQKGEVKEVASGYARNFLLPKGLAIIASKGALNIVEQKIKAEEKKSKLLKENAEKIKKELGKKAFNLKITGGPVGKIYGSVTHKEIADLINNETDFAIDKKQILVEPIKKVGEHKVKIRLHEDIIAIITLKLETKKKKTSKKK